MTRWFAVALVVLLIAMAILAYERPDVFPGQAAEQVPRIAWAVMALMLASGAGFGFWRMRRDGGYALAGAVFWGAALMMVTLIYGWLNR